MAQEPANTTETQSEEPDQITAEMNELKLRQVKANTEKAISEANQAAAEADKAAAEASIEAIKSKWSISETEGLKGTITLEDSAGYYAEILAYMALDDAAQDIAVKTKDKLKAGDLIILGEVDLTTEKALWNLLNLKLDLAIDKIEELTITIPQMVEMYEGESAGIIEGLVAGPAILGAITDIIAFFKTNYTISGRTIALNEKALIATVANHISSQNADLKILLPEYNLTDTFSIYSKIRQLNKLLEKVIKERDKIEKELDDKIGQNSGSLALLIEERNALNTKIDEVPSNIEDLNNDLLVLENKIYNLKSYERSKGKIVGSINKDIEATQELISILTSRTDSTTSLLGNIATIDFIHRNSAAKILYLTIASQGGEVETSEASLSQGRISYLGAVVITYILSDAEGVYYHSGNVQKRKTASYKRKEGAGKLEIK